MWTEITPFAKDCYFLPLTFRVMFKFNVIVFQIFNTTKVKLCCPQYLLEIFQLKEINHDGLRGSSDFIILKLPQNRNRIVASIVNYWNNLDHSIRYEPDLSKFRKLLETHYFRLVYQHSQG